MTDQQSDERAQSTAPAAAAAGYRQWIRRFHPHPEAEIRLICLPHAGGGAPSYLPTSAAMTPEVQVLAVQYPGRQERRREPLIGSVDGLADELFRVLEPDSEQPFALFGHSMGAMVAYELALRFEDAGRPPLRLFASGRRAPSRYRPEENQPLDDESLLAELRELSGTDKRLFQRDDLLRASLPVLRNDYLAADAYVHRPEAKLHSPITVLVGDQDPHVTMDEARSWREHTTGDIEVLVYAGGHFYLTEHQEQVVSVIAERLAPERG
jgi:surfactin synthase thioesterase subunit